MGITERVTRELQEEQEQAREAREVRLIELMEAQGERHERQAVALERLAELSAELGPLQAKAAEALTTARPPTEQERAELLRQLSVAINDGKVKVTTAGPPI